MTNVKKNIGLRIPFYKRKHLRQIKKSKKRKRKGRMNFIKINMKSCLSQSFHLFFISKKACSSIIHLTVLYSKRIPTDTVPTLKKSTLVWQMRQ